MKLFINDGICGREGFNEIKKIENDFLELHLPNYLQDERKDEEIKFIFQILGFNEESLKTDLLLQDVSLEKLDENTYVIRKLNNESKEECMYALLKK